MKKITELNRNEIVDYNPIDIDFLNRNSIYAFHFNERTTRKEFFKIFYKDNGVSVAISHRIYSRN